MTLTELNLFNKRITKRITHVNHTFISCDKVINKYQKKKISSKRNLSKLTPYKKKRLKILILNVSQSVNTNYSQKEND